MADINQQSDELAREFERLRQAVQNNGEGLDKAAEKTAKFGEAAATGAKMLASGFKDFALQVGQGNTEFKSLNGAIDAAAGAAAGLAKTLPFVGEAVSAALKATGEAAKFVVNQLDQTNKSFQQLSEVGAVTAKGMTGVQQQFLKSGMSMDGFKKSIIDNSNTLARWGTTVSAGADNFTKAVGDITKSKAGDELRRLGFSADAMGEAAAGFLKQQTLLGRQNKVTQDNLGQSTAQYGRELDQLAKLTGMSRKDAEKQRESALQEGKFLASIRDLQDIGPAGEKAAKEIQAFQGQIAAVAPQTAKGIRDLTSGMTNTVDAQKLIRTTGGAAVGIMEQLKSGQIDSIRAQTMLTQAVSDNEKSQRQYAKTVGDGNDVMVDYKETVALQGLASKDEAKTRADLATSSKAAAEGGDALTDSAVQAQKNMEAMNREIQALGFTLMPKAASAIETLTGATRKFVEFINKTLGVSTEKETGKGAGGVGVRESARMAVAASPEVKAANAKVAEAKKAEAKAYEDSTILQRVGIGRTAEQQAATAKLDATQKDLRDKENQVRQAAIAREQSKETSAIAGKEVQIQLDMLKFRKADKAGFEEYTKRKNAIFNEELEALTKGKNLTGRDLQQARRKAQAIAEQKSAIESAGKIKAAGAGSVTVGPAASGSGGGSASGGGTPSGAQAAAASGSAGGGGTPSGAQAAASGGKDSASVSKTGVGGSAPPSSSKGGGAGGAMSEDELKKMIIAHEGIRYEPYKDSLGLWTVGVGHLIGDGKSLPQEWNRKFSQEEIMQLFEKDYQHHRTAAERIPGFGKFNSMGQGALTDLTFNMGPAWIKKFPNTAKQIEAGNAGGAASGLQDSLWYKQVGRRGPAIVDMVKNGGSGPSAKYGGVLSGPTSGFQATLHGNEAVIPLAGGRSIPLEIPGLMDSQQQNNALLMQLIAGIDELVSVSRTGNKTNKDILRQSRA